MDYVTYIFLFIFKAQGPSNYFVVGEIQVNAYIFWFTPFLFGLGNFERNGKFGYRQAKNHPLYKLHKI